MKIMGMDIGDRYIGIALTDREKKMSVPVAVLENDAGFNDRLCSIMDREGVEKIVVGMPYTLRGEIGQQGKKVLEFVNEKILDTGAEIVYQDERFTSKLRLGPGMKNKKGSRKDKFSAALILQGYLDRTSAVRRDDDE